ncbi:hypothetical protein HMPREF9554_01855 [Treponema phagedenis F0421]|nr:hypothetical protein HMPREF9554_01855 [Treponema phagedenis F0421]
MCRTLFYKLIFFYDSYKCIKTEQGIKNTLYEFLNSAMNLQQK